MITLLSPGPARPETEHNLTVKKSCPNFNEGETLKCWIMKIGKRFAVWDSTWKHTTKYHVFASVDELNEHFDELSRIQQSSPQS